jgi:hypothetical protein
MFRIIPATEAHAREIAPRMRVSDVEEVFAATGRGRLSALLYSLERSDFSYTIEFDGRPETMFGCGTSNLIGKVGAPWLLGTSALEHHRRHFLGGSRFWIEKMKDEYAVLRNIVDDRNTVSKRWLQWLGFTLSEPQATGYEQLPFRIFEMKGNLCAI